VPEEWHRATNGGENEFGGGVEVKCQVFPTRAVEKKMVDSAKFSFISRADRKRAGAGSAEHSGHQIGSRGTVRMYHYCSPKCRECKSYFSPSTTYVGQKNGREKAGKRWACGVDREEVEEDLADDFVRQCEDRIYVGIESLFRQRFLASQYGQGALEILNFCIEVCD
jgi:hypothetical protein